MHFQDVTALLEECDKIKDELEEEQEDLRLRAAAEEEDAALSTERDGLIKGDNDNVEVYNDKKTEADNNAESPRDSKQTEETKPRKQFVWRLKEPREVENHSVSDSKPNSPTTPTSPVTPVAASTEHRPIKTRSNSRSRSRSRTTSSSVLMIGMPKHERLPEAGIVSELVGRFEQGSTPEHQKNRTSSKKKKTSLS